MRYLKCLFLIMVTCLLPKVPPAIHANFAPIIYFATGVVAPPEKHEAIRLESEVVKISLKKDTYVVDAVFTFYNTGEGIDQWIGFPFNSFFCAIRDQTSFVDFIRFEAWINGAKTAFNRERNIKGKPMIFPAPISKIPMFWQINKAHFKGYSHTKLRVTYEALYTTKYDWKPFVERYVWKKTGKIRSKKATYIYWTGSLWKDEIGHATFVIDCSQVGGASEVRSLFSEDTAQEIRSENIIEYRIKKFIPRNHILTILLPTKIYHNQN